MFGGFGMGAMDMGMGMDMMGMGAMEMEVGAMDMAMGMPMLGAEMMAMGAMEMNAGRAMADVGMMEMGMMGPGMMMGGPGMMGPGMYRRPYRNRGVGICAPGCMGPCCGNQRVIVRNPPPVVRPPPQQVVRQQPPPRARQPVNQPAPQDDYFVDEPSNKDIEQQRYIQEKIRLEKQRKQQRMQRQQIEEQNLAIERNKLDRQRKLLEQKKEEQRQEMAMFRRVETRDSYAEKNFEQRKSLLALPMDEEDFYPSVNQYTQDQVYYPQQQQPQKQPQHQPQQPQVLFQGEVYHQRGGWQVVQGATVTADRFINFDIHSITKIKVKSDVALPRTRIVKICTREDHFFAVSAQMQAHLMCALFYAKLNSMGMQCNPNETFNGRVEGEVLRKTFWSDWSPKYALISNGRLQLSEGRGYSPILQVVELREIWSRFEVVRGMLVIKMHVDSSKNEIAIPVKHAMLWLRGLYTIIR